MSATEITAHDVETAIRIGLAQMDLLRAEVKIEVLEEGSKGVLGIGAKPARVRLTPYAETVAKETGEQPSVPESSNEQDDDQPAEDAEEIIVEPEPAAQVVSQAPEVSGPQDDSAEVAEKKQGVTSEDVELAAALAQGVLDRMDLAASCASRLIDPPGGEDSPSVWVDIQGADASRLLAHQCEALDALQIVIQTMWAHQTKSNLRVTIDADSYKARREKRIQQMAERLAEKVIESGRSITLEPMPASERRLVHIALREHAQVMTESHGEGSARCITIKLK